MANFFNFFPKTLYLDSNNKSIVPATNILSRVKFLDKLKYNTSSYQYYDIKPEGETPEILADRFYSTPERHWIILLFNNIIDPQFDWYLSEYQLNLFVENKYKEFGGLQYAANNIYDYQIKEIKTVYSDVDKFVQTFNRVVDKETYDSIIPGFVPEKEKIIDGYNVTYEIQKYSTSLYEREIYLNEKKRRIKILREIFVPAVETEMRALLKGSAKPSI